MLNIVAGGRGEGDGAWAMGHGRPSAAQMKTRELRVCLEAFAQHCRLYSTVFLVELFATQIALCSADDTDLAHVS